MYALANTTPPKPGLVRSHEANAGSIEVEVWELAPLDFATFMELVPPPMCIGTVELEDGEKVKGFLVEPYAIAEATEITELGGWRNYIKTR